MTRRRPPAPEVGETPGGDGTGSSQVNMTDIARAAGVSMATTSRALNGAPGVAPATRERVLRAAREHAYVVSPEASRLSRGTTRRIAVVVPHLSRWFFSAMLEGVESALRRADLDLLLYRLGEGDERSSFFERLPARRKVDGLIVVGFPVSEPEQERLALMGVQIVAAGGQVAPYPYVSIDDQAAGTQAMNHLLNLGHRRIAMIDTIDPNASEWPVDGRALAYTEALEAAGVEVEPDLFLRVPWGAAAGAEAMATLLTLREPPTAVFAHSDEIAMGALRTIRQAGLKVPEDISVIGVDDHPLAVELGLTTIRQDVQRQGELAAQVMVDALAGAPQHEPTLLPTRLVLRSSTGRPQRRVGPGSK
jgi:DNA-binding LacI/PurR family transcriptional regulator